MNLKIKPDKPVDLKRAIEIIKDVFVSAAERDIYTGDGVILHIITSKGVEEQRIPLRCD